MTAGPSRSSSAAAIIVSLWVAVAGAALAQDRASGPAFTPAIKSRFSSQLRQRSPTERVAVLEELAAYHDVEAARLILQYGLRDRTADVYKAAARALCASRHSPAVERFLIDELRHELSEKRRTPSDLLPRLALVVASFRTESATRELMQFAADADQAVRLLILEQLFESIDRGAEEGDLQLLDVLEYLAGTSLFESSHGLRKCVFDAACRLREPRAVGFLIRHLERIDGQLQYDVVEHLRRVTRQPLTVDVESWSRWWGRAGRDFQFPAEMASTQPFSREGSPLYYYDVAVHARRLVFLLDTSKSMGAGGNVSRLEAAKRELIKTIERLPAEARFNVILFHSSIHKWSDHLQPATDAAKTHATAFIRAQKPAGKTATYDALQAAFALGPDVEAAYLLSDGVPSEGAIVAPEPLLDAIRKQNRTRRLQINTFGAFGGQQAAGFEAFMRKLAAQNYGEFRRLD